jgi:hypothetical protein
MAASAVIAGRAAADMLNAAAALVVLAGCGLAVGWHPHHGLARALAPLPPPEPLGASCSGGRPVDRATSQHPELFLAAGGPGLAEGSGFQRPSAAEAGWPGQGKTVSSGHCCRHRVTLAW